MQSVKTTTQLHLQCRIRFATTFICSIFFTPLSIVLPEGGLVDRSMLGNVGWGTGWGVIQGRVGGNSSAKQSPSNATNI